MTGIVAAIDQGTTSTRCILFDRQGRPLADARREHRQIMPAPGHVEHDATEIVRNVHAVAGEALAAAGLEATAIEAVGVTNQRETTVLWDKATGAPLHTALVWMDTRTDALVRALSEAHGRDVLRAVTGLPLATYFSGLKLAWLLDAVPGARARAERGEVLFGTIDCWLAWNLTGRHVIDVTNASRTQLMDLATLAWDAGALELLRVPRACLPEIVPSSGTIGRITTGPLAGRPLAGLVGDQQAALIGQACLAPGMAKNTYGTGCFLLMNTGASPVPSTHGLLTTVAYQFGDAPATYALEGSIAIAGALVQWLRDNLGIIGSSAEVETLAREVEDAGGVAIVPAFSGLYAPHWNDRARGLVAGLTRFADKRHICRAALEATAYQTREVLDAMATDSGVHLSDLRVDGGMAANDLMLQIQADTLARPVVRPASVETTALGAATCAALATGAWGSLDAVASNWRSQAVFSPRIDEAARRRGYAQWRKAVARSMDWLDA